MWLFNSSIGKKLIMSISGAFLVLFLLFHATMNAVAIFSAEGYNAICEFLGANWYALVGTMVIAFFVLLHFVYAFILTIQNRKARGNNAYAISEKPKNVEWASQNMLVLGLIVICGILLHLSQFWAHMQFAEIAGTEGGNVAGVADGAAWIRFYFSQPWIAACYVVWLVALWFHLSHGVWSAMQTLGWSNKIWFERWRCISTVVTTIIIAAFIAVVLAFAFHLVPCECTKACCAAACIN